MFTVGQIPIRVFGISHNQLVSGFKTNLLIIQAYGKKKKKKTANFFLRCFCLPVCFNEQSLIVYSALCQRRSGIQPQTKVLPCFWGTTQLTEMKKMLFWSSLNLGLWYIWSSCFFSSSFSADTSNQIMELPSQNLKTTPSLSLGRFHISEDCGFLLPNPLVSIEPLIGSK